MAYKFIMKEASMQYSSILYVDFNNKARKKYQTLFENSVKQVYVVDNKEDACHYYMEYNPDIIVIELSIDQALNWVKTVRRKDRETVFLALTEDSSISTLKEIVELSFSGYIIKPAEENEINSTLLKIANNLKYKQNIFLALGCQWDQKSKILLCQGKKIFLTPRESRLFEFLVKNRDLFCSDDEIYYNIWKDELDRVISTASIRTLVKNLRKKVPNGLILNRYGVGYKVIA